MSFSRDLQATHQILNLLEASKSRNEILLDHMHGVFAVINTDGVILRGNHELSRLMKLSMDQLLGNYFPELFRKETWNTFRMQLDRLEQGQFKSEFELVIDAQHSAPYYWYLTKFKAPVTGPTQLYSVIGQDISELRKLEREVTQFFSSVPLGILTIGKNGKIEGRYSAYTEWLLGRQDISEENVKKLLFEPGWKSLSRDEQEVVDNLGDLLNGPRFLFDEIRDILPKKIYYPRRVNGIDHERYLGIHYQPVYYGDEVEKLLLLIEDKTERVREQALEKEKQENDQKNKARARKIKKSLRDLFPLVAQECGALIARLLLALQEEDEVELLSLLHALQGNARIAGFELLQTLSYELQCQLTEHMMKPGAPPLEWPAIEGEVLRIKWEWEELQALFEMMGDAAEPEKSMDVGTQALMHQLFQKYRALFSTGIAEESKYVAERLLLSLNSMNFSRLKDSEPKLKAFAQDEAERQRKSASIDFSWDDVRLDDESRATVAECLQYLITHVLSRAERGTQARITVRATERNGILRVIVEDDAPSIRVEDIRNVALKGRLLTLDEAFRMSEETQLQFIFRTDFCSVEDAGGAKMGLDAVKIIVESSGGQVRVENRPDKGARFDFSLKIDKPMVVQKRCVPLADFAEQLKKHIRILAEQEGFSVDVAEEQDESLKRGIFFGDTHRLILAVTTMLGSFCSDGPVKVKLRKSQGRSPQLSCVFTLERKSAAAPGTMTTKPEFTYPIAMCEEYIREHGGLIHQDLSSLQIDIGHILTHGQLPSLYFAMDASARDMAPSALKESLSAIVNAVDELDLMGEYEWQGGVRSKKPDIYVQPKTAKPSPAVEGEDKAAVLLLGLPQEQIRESLLKIVKDQMGVSS